MVFSVATNVLIKKATFSRSASLSRACLPASVVKRSCVFRQPTDNVDVMKTLSKAFFMMVWLLKVLLGPVGADGTFFVDPRAFFFLEDVVAFAFFVGGLGRITLIFLP
jgi:hypothetical protein